MSKQNLTELFQYTCVDLVERMTDLKIRSLQLLHLYHAIMMWYNNNKIKVYEIYEYLLDDKYNIKNLDDLQSIPFDLKAHYVSIIEPFAIMRTFTNVEQCMEHIMRLESYDIHCKTIFFQNGTTYYIVFKYYYNNKILLINVDTLEITEFPTMESCIEHVSTRYTGKFKYQIASITYTPYNYEVYLKERELAKHEEALAQH